MSADYTGPCPNCLSIELGKPISELTIDDYIDSDAEIFQEHWDIYFEAGDSVFRRDGQCSDCDYEFAITSRTPLPEGIG